MSAAAFDLPTRVGGAPAATRAVETTAALLLAITLVLLLGGFVTRYVFKASAPWIDEAVTACFLWFVMLGALLAVRRHEHLRMTVLVDRLPPRWRVIADAAGQSAALACVVALAPAAFRYAVDEWAIATPALALPGSFRAAALPVGFAGMALVMAARLRRTATAGGLVAGLAVLAGIAVAVLVGRDVEPVLSAPPVLLVCFGLIALGVPIAFGFACAVVAYLLVQPEMPVVVAIGRIDEGMSPLLLVSVPAFVLLGRLMDTTGMGRAIVAFLASAVGHLRAGMSHVLLVALFIVSGISGSKVSDMATVAPALFPAMRRRGDDPGRMVALLATGAAMAETVPPSITLIVLGSIAGVSIARLFDVGLAVAAVLLVVLMAAAHWQAGGDRRGARRRPSWRRVGRLLVLAAPALLLPFLVRAAVGSGVATATEVSVLAVLYAALVALWVHRGVGWTAWRTLLADTAATTGAILLLLGAASALAWVLAHSGAVQQLTAWLGAVGGGKAGFMAVTIVIFVVLGCLLEGLPALTLLAPITFPIARRLGIDDVHYAMVVTTAMNIGLMAPPLGVGFYVACQLGHVAPARAMRAMVPYLGALTIGLLLIAFVPL